VFGAAHAWWQPPGPLCTTDPTHHPSRTSLHAGNLGPGNEHLELLLDHIKTKWPYWNRTQGKDHFFVSRRRCCYRCCRLLPPLLVCTPPAALQHLCHSASFLAPTALPLRAPGLSCLPLACPALPAPLPLPCSGHLPTAAPACSAAWLETQSSSHTLACTTPPAAGQSTWASWAQKVGGWVGGRAGGRQLLGRRRQREDAQWASALGNEGELWWWWCCCC
jgi:hypothetical protein